MTQSGHNRAHDPKGVTCTDKRISTFGWTDKRVALAELAAIAKWQKQIEKNRPGYCPSASMLARVYDERLYGLLAERLTGF